MKSRSVLRLILLPMLLLLLIQAVLFASSIQFGGTVDEIEKNAFEVLSERVLNRANYLENEMIQRWSNLDSYVQDIQSTVLALLEESSADPQDLNAHTDLSTRVLATVSGRLINMLRVCSVTDAFLILHGDGASEEHACLWLRDSDPITSSSSNKDLMIEYAPSVLTRELGISIDSYWEAYLSLSGDESYYANPLSAAVEIQGLSTRDLGYWGPPIKTTETDESRLTYTVALCDRDGVPFGVLGIAVSSTYLDSLLPKDELASASDNSYCLAWTDPSQECYQVAKTTGSLFQNLLGNADSFLLGEADLSQDAYAPATQDGEALPAYASVSRFNLYNSNTPFSSQEWVLVGMIRESTLLSTTYSLEKNILIALGISVIINLVCILLITMMITRPITRLAAKVRTSDTNQPIRLEPTGIQEMDQVSAAIEYMSQSVADEASRMSTILRLAGVPISAFEYHKDTGVVYITGTFIHSVAQMLELEILPAEGETSHTSRISIQAFRQYMKRLVPYLVPETCEPGTLYYRLPDANSRTLWMRLKLVADETRIIGVGTDVTQEMEERRRIEYERDYDVLTSLLNRRAYQRRMTELFEHPEHLKTAALIMLDLDNLKYVNDSYGHDCGDNYIRSTASLLLRSSPSRSIISRMSGDEFYVFHYGYEGEEDLRPLISTLEKELRQSTFQLPDGRSIRIRASAGVAWYPKDAQNFDELMLYADFAMYQVKNTVKGSLNEFDLATYQREAYMFRGREELNKLIEEELLEYVFQPIVDLRTGQVFAYEALMRSHIELLRSPLEILRLARNQSKLYQIERLTWYKSLESFYGQREAAGECKLFVNSISNQALAPEDRLELEEKYGDFLSRIVLELTENEAPDENCLEEKRSFLTAWRGELALDDYGNGYSGDVALLNLAPNYIKVDMSIVRNIDTDETRQTLFQYIVDFSQKRGIKIIAEGVETAAELKTLVHFGADYVQGYYTGKPARELVRLSPEKSRELVDLWRDYGPASH